MRTLDAAFLALALSAAAGNAAAADERANRFNDPFVLLSSAIRDCPEPLGPRITAAEQLKQSHHRAERGTTCWLQGLCERPNAFEYDPGIARTIQRAWSEHKGFQASTIWLTVQGRVVFFEGCARRRGLAAELERFARGVPNVTQAVANIRTEPKAKPPYAVWRQASTSGR